MFTISGILLLRQKQRMGWIVAAAGSVLWFYVAAVSLYSGRPIYAQMVLSVATFCVNLSAWRKWGR